MKIDAPPWIMVILVLLVLWQVKVWHDENDPRPSATAAGAAPRTTVHSNPTPNPNRRDLRESRELIRAVSETYDVPAGLLYGIWRKESGGLASGYGTSASWHRASDLASPGSRCFREYNAERCGNWFTGLQAVCSQLRNGRPICDANEVRTSYAFAMGPMQLLPSSVLAVRPDGTTTWTAYAVDFDRDGTVDPHSLPDAMAMAARHVRLHYEQRAAGMSANDAWIWAANRYYGSQTAGYYEGTTAGRRGIQDYWREWCETISSCTSREMVASN